MRHLINFAKPCVFGKQSPGPFLCALLFKARVPFFRSYGVNLPNSLAMIHSSTSGFSPFPPVSVYGTGSDRLDRRSFSWESDYRHYQIARRLSVLSAFSRDYLLNCPFTYNIKPAIPSAGGRVTPPSLR